MSQLSAVKIYERLVELIQYFAPFDGNRKIISTFVPFDEFGFDQPREQPTGVWIGHDQPGQDLVAIGWLTDSSKNSQYVIGRALKSVSGK